MLLSPSLITILDDPQGFVVKVDPRYIYAPSPFHGSITWPQVVNPSTDDLRRWLR